MPGIHNTPQGGVYGAMMSAFLKPKSEKPLASTQAQIPQTALPKAGVGAAMGAALTSQMMFAPKNAQEGQANSSLSFVDDSSSEPTPPINTIILSAFDQIDFDQDAYIAYDELLSQMRNPKVKGEKAATVALLILAHQAGGSTLHDEGWLQSGDGLSRRDIEKLSANVSIGVGNGRDLSVSDLHAALNHKINQAETQRTPSGGFKLPTSTAEINYKTIDQNVGTGDCYFVAGIAALASQTPQKILDMIQDNQNGTYTVSFADKKATISAPTDTEIALNSKGGTWMPILEKAYAHYRNGGDGTDSGLMAYLSNAYTQGTLDVPYPEANPYQKIDARSLGDLAQTIEELTGNSGTLSLFDETSLEHLDNTLKNAIQNKKIIITGNSDKNKINKQFVYAHAYAVTNYNAATQTVSLKNPWGNLRGGAEPELSPGQSIDAEYDGYFELSLEDFYKYFSFLTTENQTSR